MKKIFLLFIALCISTLVSYAQPIRVHDAPFAGGEELIYNVSYRAALIPPINLMKVSLRTMEEKLGDKPHYHVVGNGKTSGVAASIFDLNDTYHTWLDAATLLPTRMKSDLHENDYRLRATYNYDWNTMKVTTQVHRPHWPADQYTQMPLTPESGDAFSLIYRLRASDVDTMKPGHPHPLDLVLNQVVKPIHFTYIGRERIKIRKLGERDTLKFTCTMATSDGSTYEEGMTLTVWVSDDERRVPLMIECPVRVGRVSVTLAQ